MRTRLTSILAASALLSVAAAVPAGVSAGGAPQPEPGPEKPLPRERHSRGRRGAGGERPNDQQGALEQAEAKRRRKAARRQQDPTRRS